MRTSLHVFASLVGAIAVSSPVLAQDGEAEAPFDIREHVEIETGSVTIGRNLATLDLPEGWGYLQAAGARTVVEQYWGNPEDLTTLGLVVPENWEANETAPTWAIIVSFEEDGYVDDSDAKDLDFDDLLATMKEDSEQSNEARKEAGYETVDLIGWAEPPHYESTNHTIYWAKELRFEGQPTNTLNYNMRVLGRRGVLVLNAVADIGELDEVKQGGKRVLQATRFTSGNRYDDYVSGDKIAAYGIGGLIAGKLLLKGGFLKLLVSLWKPIALGLVGVGALVMRFLGKKKEPAQAEA